MLSLVKNETRTTVSDERLNALCLMAIESSLVRSLDFESVIIRFASSKACRLQRNCKPNLIVRSSMQRNGTTIALHGTYVLLCDPRNLHRPIALLSRHVNDSLLKL